MAFSPAKNDLEAADQLLNKEPRAPRAPVSTRSTRRTLLDWARGEGCQEDAGRVWLTGLYLGPRVVLLPSFALTQADEAKRSVIV